MVDFQRYPQTSNGEKPSKNEESEEKMTPQIQKQRICDFCGESKALVYCRADSAKLCFHCDREVHSTNPLFTKHSRSQLCDLCDRNPASIHCSTENLVLCQNCDWESHNQSSSSSTSVHDRRPLEGFTGCPSGIELSSILGFEDLRDKCLLNVHGGGGGDCCLGCGDFESMGDVNGFSNLLVWETPAIVSFDDLIVSNGSNQNFPAMGIPPLPKNRNTVCGKYKEEIIRQLHNMVNLETCWTYDQEGVESLLGFKPLVSEQNLQPENMGLGSKHDTEPVKLNKYEVDNATQWQGDYDEKANQNFDPSTYLENYFEDGFLVPDEPNGVGSSKTETNGDQEEQSYHTGVIDILPVVPKVATQELTSHNRDSMISRYKEKRKTRRYDKHIRYESRKARAESRTRIKGRFAKVLEK